MELPKPPSHLDATAKAHWRKLVPLLDEAGILAPTDCDALELYCVVYSRWRKAEAELVKAELTDETPNKYQVMSAQLNAVNTCIKQKVTLMNALGLTPAARKKVEAVQKPLVDDLSEYLKGQNG